MKTGRFAKFLLFFLILLSGHLNAGNPKVSSDIHPGVAVFKVTVGTDLQIISQSPLTTGIEKLDQIFTEINAVRVERTYPHCLPPVKGGTDLTRIFTVFFPEVKSVNDVCEKLTALKVIEYAAPRYIQFLDIVPNDAYRHYQGQYGLDLCDSDRAHDIATGHKSVPIAIVDTGMDMDHPDLVDNLWVNPGEDLNGDGIIQNNERNRRDDDGNGMIDDFHGWDFVGDDNYPEDEQDYEDPGHGTHVAGISSATTNNRIGVSSIGHSCGIMVVRSGSEFIPYGYEGIEYAARIGAKVINCSWGSAFGGRDGQDVINYAHEHDALVIAAAGNDNTSDLHYPSAYNHVVAVASTDEHDRRSGFSNFGRWVDISAPGSAILSTVINAQYGVKYGTSMASPFTAGVAVLIRAAYPEYSNVEAEVLLLNGVDDISEENPDYDGELGVGRINAYQSLMLGPHPDLFVRSLDIAAEEIENGRPDLGETVEITFEFLNPGNNPPANDLRAFLTSDDPSFVFEIGEVSIPDIAPGGRISNTDDPFIVSVRADTIPHSSSLHLAVLSNERLYAVRQTFEIVIDQPQILIVDDDSGNDIESYYFHTLENLESGWVRWSTARDGVPDPNELSGYDMVIWMTGNSAAPLDEEERLAIEDAFYTGSNILLSGKMIGDDANNRDMLENVFGAEHLADSVNAATVEGIGGDRPIPDEAEMFLFGHGGAPDGRNSPSTMSPVNGADSLLIYKYRDPVMGLAGVYREYISEEADSSKVIYLGFGFESISEVRTSREQTLQNIYDWFRGLTAAPLKEALTAHEFILEPAYPNPFNSQTRVGFSLPGSAEISLGMFDLNGRLVQNITERQRFNAGYHSLTVDAGNLTAGQYLIQIDYSGQSQVVPVVLLK